MQIEVLEGAWNAYPNSKAESKLRREDDFEINKAIWLFLSFRLHYSFTICDLKIKTFSLISSLHFDSYKTNTKLKICYEQKNKNYTSEYW